MVKVNSVPRPASWTTDIASEPQRGHPDCAGNVWAPQITAARAEQAWLFTRPGEDALGDRHLGHRIPGCSYGPTAIRSSSIARSWDFVGTSSPGGV